MRTEELLERADKRIAEVEDIKRIRKSIEDLELLNGMLNNAITLITLHQGSMEERLDTWLDRDEYKELKGVVESKLYECTRKRIAKLEQLLGIRKPATINPIFEAAVQEMVESNKSQTISICADSSAQTTVEDKTEPTEEPATFPALDDTTVEDVRRMYQQENMTQGDIAAHYGVKKGQVNTFISKHGLFRTSYKKDDIFLDAKVEAQAGKEGL